jgi:20S proteasome alpha/beta subunit
VTLVLAVRCRDGVVLASDGQATTDAAGQPTKQAARKLFDVDGRLAWGAAGSVGLQQTLRSELAALDCRGRDAATVRRALAGVVIPIQQEALRDYVPQPGSDPPDLACIFAWWDGSGPSILSIPRTGSDHQFHPRYSAIGSGDIFADFAMASVAHLGTADLGLEHAKMVAYKAIADAIEVAAVYVGPPIQMYVVTGAGARPVPREEVGGELAGSVDAWKARQRESLGPLAPAPPPLRSAVR